MHSTVSAVAAAIALALLAAPGVAQTGRFGDDCSRYGGEEVVEMRGNALIFYETACSMSNPVSVRGMPGATLYDLNCSGEGETWTDRAFMRLDSNGELVLVMQNYARILPRCR